MIVDLMLQDDQVLIAESVSAFFTDRLPVARFRDETNWGGKAEAALWQELAELGLFGFGVAAEADGLGMSMAEDVIVAFAAGEHLVSPGLIASMAAAHIGTTHAYVAGERRAAFANPLAPASGSRLPVHLIDAEGADELFVSTPGASYLLPVSAIADALPVEGMDETVSLTRAIVDLSAATAVAKGNGLFRRSELLLAAYLAGAAQAVRDMAVEYAKIREQFGQPIGAFQAIKHACADMARRSEAATCQTRYAAALAGSGEPGLTDTACARVLSGDAALENARANIQVHGGMGFTHESDAHFFLKRAQLVTLLNNSKPVLLQQIIAEDL